MAAGCFSGGDEWMREWQDVKEGVMYVLNFAEEGVENLGPRTAAIRHRIAFSERASAVKSKS